VQACHFLGVRGCATAPSRAAVSRLSHRSVGAAVTKRRRATSSGWRRICQLSSNALMSMQIGLIAHEGVEEEVATL